MIQEVFREKQRIDNLFDMAQQLNAKDELLAHWAKYLCVITAGFIENSVRTLLCEYAKNKASPAVTNYVESTIKGVTNLKEEKISQLLGSFSSQWRETFVGKRTDAQKDAIDSVIANRHLIAHGRQVGLTINRMREYYGRVVEVIKLIDEQCVNS